MKTFFLLLIFLFCHSALSQELEVLPDATGGLAKRIYLIRSAKSGETIRLSTYIFAADDVGKLMTFELGKALEKGVKVEIMFDAQGVNLVRPTDPFLKYLNVLGAKIKKINPLFATLVNYNRRMHDKIMTFDNKLAIVGGRNLWNYAYDLWSKPQKDLEILVRDNQTLIEIQDYWKERWTHSTSKDYELRLSSEELIKFRSDLAAFVKQFKQTKYYSLFNAQILGPTFSKVENVKFVRDQRWKKAINFPQISPNLKTWDHIEEIEIMLNKANSEILIESPWIVLTKRMKSALSAARSRGVNIKILTNSAKSSESSYTYYISRASSARFLERIGVEVYEHNPDISLHSKYIVVDRKTTYVGTFNIGGRSERINSETGIIFESLSKSEEVANNFENRVKQSTLSSRFRYLDNPCWNLVSFFLSSQI